MDGLSHIGLKSSDLGRTERFYTEVLKGEVVRRREEPDRRAWLDVAGVRLEIAEVPPWPALDEEQRRALPMVAFLIAPGQVDEVVARLEAAGIPHHGPVLKATGSGVGVYFGDPDGNAIALSCQEGYPPDGLARNTGRSWAPAPYAWPGTPSGVR
jgi:catechol 2,3-dioxygenase-like lactoylglutathione lyase family enzyme